MIYLEVIIICLIGAVLQGAIGFGFPIFVMIFFSSMFPMPQAVALTQCSCILGVGYFVVKYHKKINWKVLLPFLLSAVAFGVICTLYSTRVNLSGLKLWLGVLLVILAIFFLFVSERLKVKASAGSGVALGAVSGAMSGFFAIGGPPAALYLLPATGGDKLSYIATTNTYFFIFNFVSIGLRISGGIIGREYAGLVLAGMLSMAAGSFLGDRLMRRLPMGMLKKFVCVFEGVSGLILMIEELAA